VIRREVVTCKIEVYPKIKTLPGLILRVDERI
jgi:hypothetical protein